VSHAESAGRGKSRIVVTPELRQWWLGRYSLAQIIDMAEATWPTKSRAILCFDHAGSPGR
jgi:hypothetical protein